MDLEKTNGNTKWFKKNNLRIMLKSEGKESIIAVILDGYNICLKLMMFDFAERVKEELLLDIQIKKLWNNQRVFTINSNEALSLVNYIPKFISEWNLKISKNTVSDVDAISDDIWYRKE